MQYRDLTGAFSVPSWVGDTGLSFRGVGLGLYDQGRGIVSLATPAGWRAVAEGTAEAYHEGGIGLAVNQFNPVYHLLVNVDNGWQLAQQGCITQASRALTNATINAATTLTIATGAAAATRNTATTRTATNRASVIPIESQEVIQSIRNDGVIVQSGVKGPAGPKEFRNDGGTGGQVLPRVDSAGSPITYREWGTIPSANNPKPGGERIVTGSDGSVYYSPDHYQTFVRTSQ